MPLGVIVGTGLDEVDAAAWEPLTVHTPHGPVPAFAGELGGRETFLLPRHGPGHQLPPHRLNYAGNLAALHLLGCERLLACHAVGGIGPGLAPGTLCLPHQFLDFTCLRARTLFEPPEHAPMHADMTEPYCPDLRRRLHGAAEALDLPLVPEGVYVCTEGPRFETPAEIRMFALLGATVVGMTAVPEVVFARELGLCYASVCLVSNYAAGVTPEPVSDDEITALMRARRPEVWRLLEAVAAELPAARDCSCGGPA